MCRYAECRGTGKPCRMGIHETPNDRSHLWEMEQPVFELEVATEKVFKFHIIHQFHNETRRLITCHFVQKLNAITIL